MNEPQWCIGCDQITLVSAMRWRHGEWKCLKCFGYATELPGTDWQYKTGVSKLNGKPWAAYIPPKGSPDTAIFLPMEQP